MPRSKPHEASTAASEDAAEILKIVERGRLSPDEAREISERLTTIVESVKGKVVDTAQERKFTPEQEEALLSVLQLRFEQHQERHKGIKWDQVSNRLQEASIEKLWSLSKMDETGGEPDVVGIDEKTGEVIFYDCSKESPSGRRNIVYDRAAQDWLKENYPNEVCDGNAVELAAAMGIQILTEEEYRALQKLEEEEFDCQTWSWIMTPKNIRDAGGALDGRRGGGVVYVAQDSALYHNDRRAFRGSLRV